MNNIYCTYICWYSFITLIVLFDSICWVEITFCQSKGKSSAGVAGKKFVGHSRSPPNGSSRVNFRVFPDPRVFSNRGTTFISSISTLWSRAILSFFFWFEVNLKGSSCVQLVAAVSSPGMPSLNKTLRKNLVIFDTATEPFGHPIGRSRRLEKLNFQGKRQDSTILIFDPLKSSDESHHSNKRSIWYIFLGPYFVPIISSKSKSTRELGCFGRQEKTTRGSTIS